MTSLAESRFLLIGAVLGLAVVGANAALRTAPRHSCSAPNHSSVFRPFGECRISRERP
jgi:gas vesicle protein